jgi:hypothetical protein
LALRSSVQLFDIENFANAGSRRKLHELLGEQLEGLPRLSDAIEHRYFNLSDDTPQRAMMRHELTK